MQYIDMFHILTAASLFSPQGFKFELWSCFCSASLTMASSSSYWPFVLYLMQQLLYFQNHPSVKRLCKDFLYLTTENFYCTHLSHLHMFASFTLPFFTWHNLSIARNLLTAKREAISELLRFGGCLLP